ncbi:MAG TPA: hypothetical protein VK211_10765, partial [Kamptonema sp.]|nr:hypothetical protein [Kamptonema sp.]
EAAHIVGRCRAEAAIHVEGVLAGELIALAEHRSGIGAGRQLRGVAHAHIAARAGLDAVVTGELVDVEQERVVDWLLLIISGIFFVEAVSVIAQVGYYKATKGPDGVGKRLLKMAPLHHHLELSGWSETQVVGMFYLINAILVVTGFISH